MGLDMYLETEISLFYLDTDNIPGVKEVRAEIEKQFGQGLETTNNWIGSRIIAPLGYWRKANGIHKWFVDHVQEGIDECQRAYVDRVKLVELRDACQRVLKNHDLAAELLPTVGGFFFGGTEYSEWYYKELEYTVKIIDRIMAHLPEQLNIYYHSSW